MSIVSALLGGVLIGASTAGLLYTHGRLAGISGILAGSLAPKAETDPGGHLSYCEDSQKNVNAAHSKNEAFINFSWFS